MPSKQDEAQRAASEALECAQTTIEDGLDEAHRYLKRQWRERPITVAATALGAGLILGLLLGGRR